MDRLGGVESLLLEYIMELPATLLLAIVAFVSGLSALTLMVIIARLSTKC
jgi:hypothetical protein